MFLNYLSTQCFKKLQNVIVFSRTKKNLLYHRDFYGSINGCTFPKLGWVSGAYENLHTRNEEKIFSVPFRV